MYYGEKRDTDSDGLPNKCQGQNTYDIPTWDCGDTMSYTSSLWLSALLASKKMAEMMEDREFFYWCESLLENGRASMDKKLFNGKFYALGISKGKRKNACMVDQLLGQWATNLVNLGYILPKEHLHSAIKSILKYNAKDSPYGATNSVFPDRKRDTGDPSGRDTRLAESIWPGVTFSFGALAIQEGFVEEGLNLLKKTYMNFTENIKSALWNIPDVITPETGLPHPWHFSHYYRGGSIWSVLLAMTGFNCNTLKKEVSIIPPYSPENLVGPFVTPYGFGIFKHSKGKGEISVSLIIKEGNLSIRSLQVSNCGIKEPSISLEIGTKKIEDLEVIVEDEILKVILKDEVNLKNDNVLKLKIQEFQNRFHRGQVSTFDKEGLGTLPIFAIQIQNSSSCS